MPRHHRPRPRETMRRLRRELPGAIPINLDGPDHEVLPPLPLARVELTPEMRRTFPAGTDLAFYRLGECTAIVTIEAGKAHLSVAHHDRYPTWDELAQARYRILPHVPWVCMYFPPRSEYINLHRNCFQMYECEPIPELRAEP